MSSLLVSIEGVFEVDDKRETQGDANAGEHLPERKAATKRQRPDKPALVIEKSMTKNIRFRSDFLKPLSFYSSPAACRYRRRSASSVSGESGEIVGFSRPLFRFQRGKFRGIR
jgi:hypothetical protein